MSGAFLNITQTCFGLSYLLAFLIELLRLRWPGRALRIVGLSCGVLGLVAHSLFLAARHPTLATSYGALLSVAWVLAIFYIYGALHHARYAWSIFVLPVVMVLIALSLPLITGNDASGWNVSPPWLSGNHFWGAVHGILLLFASVGVSVGAVASAMYLIQARRLRRKLNPVGGLKLLSLERLESMNRRAVNLSFPLLTLGLLLGAVLLRHYHDFLDNWMSLKVLGTVGLWSVFLVLLYLRYANQVPGRRLALLTLLAFALMLVVLIASHPFAESPNREVIVPAGTEEVL